MTRSSAVASMDRLPSRRSMDDFFFFLDDLNLRRRVVLDDGEELLEVDFGWDFSN